MKTRLMVLAMVLLVAVSSAAAGTLEEELFALFERKDRKDPVADVKRLVEKGVDVNAVRPYPRTGETVLQVAVALGYVETVRFLVENGADMYKRDFDGGFPLGAAACVGFPEHPPVLKLLIEKGADVNASFDSGRTLLMCAAGFDHSRTIEMIRPFVDKDYIKQLLKTPGEMVRLLIKGGADVNAKDKKGYAALDYAYGANNTETIKLLKQAGAKRGEGLP